MDGECFIGGVDCGRDVEGGECIGVGMDMKKGELFDWDTEVGIGWGE